jgi:histone H3/H4
MSILDEAIYLITKATENFIKSLAKESATLAFQQKKKTIGKSHVDFALTMLPIEL